MNWVGGVRSRIKLQHEKKKQKEFFEKNRFENKINATVQKASLQNESVSQDILAIKRFKDLQEGARNTHRHRPVRMVDLDKATPIGRRPSNISPINIGPMSPGAKPSLLFSSTWNNSHSQENETQSHAFVASTPFDPSHSTRHTTTDLSKVFVSPIMPARKDSTCSKYAGESHAEYLFEKPTNLPTTTHYRPSHRQPLWELPTPVLLGKEQSTDDPAKRPLFTETDFSFPFNFKSSSSHQDTNVTAVKPIFPYKPVPKMRRFPVETDRGGTFAQSKPEQVENNSLKRTLAWAPEDFQATPLHKYAKMHKVKKSEKPSNKEITGRNVLPTKDKTSVENTFWNMYDDGTKLDKTAKNRTKMSPVKDPSFLDILDDTRYNRIQVRSGIENFRSPINQEWDDTDSLVGDYYNRSFSSLGSDYLPMDQMDIQLESPLPWNRASGKCSIGLDMSQDSRDENSAKFLTKSDVKWREFVLGKNSVPNSRDLETFEHCSDKKTGLSPESTFNPYQLTPISRPHQAKYSGVKGSHQGIDKSGSTISHNESESSVRVTKVWVSNQSAQTDAHSVVDASCSTVPSPVSTVDFGTCTYVHTATVGTQARSPITFDVQVQCDLIESDLSCTAGNYLIRSTRDYFIEAMLGSTDSRSSPRQRCEESLPTTEDIASSYQVEFLRIGQKDNVVASPNTSGCSVESKLLHSQGIDGSERATNEIILRRVDSNGEIDEIAQSPSVSSFDMNLKYLSEQNDIGSDMGTTESETGHAGTLLTTLPKCPQALTEKNRAVTSPGKHTNTIRQSDSEKCASTRQEEPMVINSTAESCDGGDVQLKAVVHAPFITNEALAVCIQPSTSNVAQPLNVQPSTSNVAQPLNVQPGTSSNVAQPLNVQPGTSSNLAQPLNVQPDTSSNVAQPLNVQPDTSSNVAQPLNVQPGREQVSNELMELEPEIYEIIDLTIDEEKKQNHPHQVTNIVPLNNIQEPLMTDQPNVQIVKVKRRMVMEEMSYEVLLKTPHASVLKYVDPLQIGTSFIGASSPDDGIQTSHTRIHCTTVTQQEIMMHQYSPGGLEVQLCSTNPEASNNALLDAERANKHSFDKSVHGHEEITPENQSNPFHRESSSSVERKDCDGHIEINRPLPCLPYQPAGIQSVDNAMEILHTLIDITDD